MEITVIIATRNNFQDTRLCLKALKMSKQVDLHEIIVVDNASTFAMKEWLSAQTDLRVFLEHENKGVAAAWNIGADAATGDFLLFMHNDVFLCANTIQLMEKAFISLDDGAVGAFTNRCHYAEQHYLSKPYQDFDGLLKNRLCPCVSVRWHWRAIA